MTADPHPIYGKNQPTNILLRTQGRASWERDLVLYTPGEREYVSPRSGRTVKVKPLGHGTKYTDNLLTRSAKQVGGVDEDSLMGVKAKAVIPRNFCPGCGKKDMTWNGDKPTQGAGIWWMIDSHPEVGLQANDPVLYYKCGACYENNFPQNEGPRRLYLGNCGWQRYDSNRRLTTEANILAYLKTARATSQENVFLNDRSGT